MYLSVEQEIWLDNNDIRVDDISILSIRKTNDLKKKWKDVFIPRDINPKYLHKCPKCSNCTADEPSSYNWHVFSNQIVHAKEVESNFLAKKKDLYGELFLMWEQCDTHGMIFDAAFVKNCKWTNTDIYIVDESFTWTFVVTHEQWFYYVER